MSERPISGINPIFYGTNLQPLTSHDNPGIKGFHAELDDIRILHKDLIASSVDQPEWFGEAMELANDHMRSIDLLVATAVHLVECDSESNLRKGEEDTTAFSSPFMPSIYVFSDVVSEYYERDGSRSVARVLVHELMHTAGNRVTDLPVIVNDSGDADPAVRTGFIVSGTAGTQGELIEESLSYFSENLFDRRQQDESCNLFGGVEAVNGDRAGPYYTAAGSSLARILQLLAVGAEKNEIMSADEFIGTTLATRRPETMLPALRTFTRTINAIQPRLYDYMRNAPCDSKSVRKVLKTVEEIVL